jgi:hypothetical protein
MKATSSSVSTDFLRLFDMAPNHQLTFSSLGWASQVNISTPYVGVIDMGPYLDAMQSGNVNVWINDDTSVDWAIYTTTVATPLADPVGPAVFLDGGSVRVDGPVSPIGSLVNGGVANSSLTIAHGNNLSVNGDYEQEPNGTLKIEIAGAAVGQFGKFTIGNEALLEGTLVLELMNGYQPSAGAAFEFLSSGSLLGTKFATAMLPDLGSTLAWELLYDLDSVLARVILPGDYNRDGAVDAADYAAWRNAAGSSVSVPGEGADGNRDGSIDQGDFSVWRANFGRTDGAGSGAGEYLAHVPESGLAASACIALATTLLIGRRRAV